MASLTPIQRMKVGIIGPGLVGQTLGGKLVALGNNVVLGTRNPNDLDSAKGRADSLSKWLAGPGRGARVASFAEAASHAEVVINATPGEISIEALRLAGANHLAGKVLIDVSNELDFSHGMPPTSLAGDTEDRSVGMRIQKAFPEAWVVKTLNTMNCLLMVNPGQLAGGDHSVFICGNNTGAKDTVTQILRSFGWHDIIDLGGIDAARGPEMYMAFWVRLWRSVGSVPGTPPRQFNVKFVR
jgi:8-hydroxy-5-deazaflavin:NADPH oxidoreductase